VSTSRWVLLSALIVAAALPAAAAAGHLEGYVPAVANGAGKMSSYWTTDVWIYQQGASQVQLWFNPAGRDNTDNLSVVVPLDGPVTFIHDVVASVFHTQGIGSLHYLADGPVEVVTRTWTSSQDGTGTYGQTIPGVPLAAASVTGTGQAGALRVVVNQSEGFRANLGLVNVSPKPVTATVEVFTADGQAAPGSSSFTVLLQPFDMTQVNDVLARLDAGSRQGLIIRAGITSGDGGLVGYLSEVDNTTNDASYQEAFVFGP